MNKTLFGLIALLILVGLGIGGVEMGRRMATRQDVSPAPTADVSAAAASTAGTPVSSEAPIGEQSVTTEAPVAPAGIAMAEVVAHNTASSCWTAINGNVYDLTQWIGKHPGGQDAIKQLCGMDGTAIFNGQHGGQKQQAQMLATFKIGALAQ